MGSLVRYSKNLKPVRMMCIVHFVTLCCLNTQAHDDRKVLPFSAQKAHAPTPLPDRVVLTWNDNPAISQSVTWRTDTSIEKGLAQLAIANANGRALEPETFEAETSFFQSDIN